VKVSEDQKPGQRIPGQCWDAKVTSQNKKWRSGKGMVYAVVLSCDDPKVKLAIVSSNPRIFKIYPQDHVFLVSVSTQAQDTLNLEDEEDET